MQNYLTLEFFFVIEEVSFVYFYCICKSHKTSQISDATLVTPAIKIRLLYFCLCDQRAFNGNMTIGDQRKCWE